MVSGRRTRLRESGRPEPIVAADTAQTVSGTHGIASTGRIGAGTSTTSWPRRGQQGARLLPRRVAPADPVRTRSATRCRGRCAAEAGSSRSHQPRNVSPSGSSRQRVGVAGLRDRHSVEKGGGVADGPGQRAVHAPAGPHRSPADPSRRGRARSSGRRVRTRSRGCGSNHHRRCPARTARTRWRRPPPAPPLEPPASRVVSHGVRAGGPMSVSV